MAATKVHRPLDQKFAKGGCGSGVSVRSGREQSLACVGAGSQ